MAERATFLRTRLTKLSEEGLVLVHILEVLEDVLYELRLQNQGDDQEEEQGPTSLSDP